MNLYYAEGDQQVGPIGKMELQSLIRSKKLNTKTLVWQPGMKNWQELGEYIHNLNHKRKPADSLSVPVKQFQCSECGLKFNEDDMIRFQEVWVCAGCKPLFVQQIKEGVSIAGALDYAGFWIRFGAITIDGFILWILSLVIVWIIGFLMCFGSIHLRRLKATQCSICHRAQGKVSGQVCLM